MATKAQSEQTREKDKNETHIVGCLPFRSRPISCNPLIGSYLGIVAKDRDELQTIWNNRAVFCLALGGSVIDNVCKAYKSFRPNRKGRSVLFGVSKLNDYE